MARRLAANTGVAVFGPGPYGADCPTQFANSAAEVNHGTNQHELL